jgi:hypothetical protein
MTTTSLNKKPQPKRGRGIAGKINFPPLISLRFSRSWNWHLGVTARLPGFKGPVPPPALDKGDCIYIKRRAGLSTIIFNMHDKFLRHQGVTFRDFALDIAAVSR